MGKGIYIRTAEGNRKISQAMLGKQHALGHNHPSPLKGLTLEEYHGKEKAKRIRRKMSIAQLGNQNGCGQKGCKHTEEHNRKVRIANLGKQYALGCKHTEEARRNQSEAVKRQYRNGEREVAFPNNWYETRKGIKVRSPWEQYVCDLLTDFRIEYEYEKQRFNLDHTTYLPDLYLPRYDLWIEVKGRMDTESAKKIKLFSQEHSLLVIDGGRYKEIQNTPRILMQLIGGVR